MTQSGTKEVIQIDDFSIELKNNNSIVELKNQKQNLHLKFELRPQNSIEHVAVGLPIHPNNIKRELDFLIDDMSEHMLEHIGTDEYKKYRKLLQRIGYFFSEFLIEVKPCPEA